MRTYTFLIRSLTDPIKEKCELVEAKATARGLAEKYDSSVFVCIAKAGTTSGYAPVAGFRKTKDKIVKIGKTKAELVELLDKAVEQMKKGGAPKKHASGVTTLSFSVSLNEKAEFELLAKKFAGGNKSDMFRRMFTAWKQMATQVVGELNEHAKTGT